MYSGPTLLPVLPQSSTTERMKANIATGPHWLGDSGERAGWRRPDGAVGLTVSYTTPLEIVDSRGKLSHWKTVSTKLDGYGYTAFLQLVILRDCEDCDHCVNCDGPYTVPG